MSARKSTKRQRNQSRINGSKNRGPVTPQGKAISSRNAVTHGLTGEHMYATGDLPACYNGEFGDYHQECDRILMEMFEGLQPKGVIEMMSAARLLSDYWRLRRIPRLETAIIDQSYLDLETGQEIDGADVQVQPGIWIKDVRLLSIYETRLERSYEKHLRRLETRQEKRQMRERYEARLRQEAAEARRHPSGPPTANGFYMQAQAEGSLPPAPEVLLHPAPHGKEGPGMEVPRSRAGGGYAAGEGGEETVRFRRNPAAHDAANSTHNAQRITQRAEPDIAHFPKEAVQFYEGAVSARNQKDFRGMHEALANLRDALNDSELLDEEAEQDYDITATLYRLAEEVRNLTKPEDAEITDESFQELYERIDAIRRVAERCGDPELDKALTNLLHRLSKGYETYKAEQAAATAEKATESKAEPLQTSDLSGLCELSGLSDQSDQSDLSDPSDPSDLSDEREAASSQPQDASSQRKNEPEEPENTRFIPFSSEPQTTGSHWPPPPDGHHQGGQSHLSP